MRLRSFFLTLTLSLTLSFLWAKEEPKIALLQSTYTKTAMPELTDRLNANLADWEIYLLNQRLVYKVITSGDLENGVSGFDLLILPSAVCLSDKEKMTIKKFLDAGGGVLATGAIGSRNEKGEWQGWKFLSSLFGVEVTGEIKLEESASLTLKANSPLSYRVPPGFRLEVTTEDIGSDSDMPPLAVKVVGARTAAVGYWYDFRIRRDLSATEVEKNCGLIYGEEGKGRFVWVGFERRAVIGVKFHQSIRDQLLSNSISYLRREPVGWINPWPDNDGAEAAVVLICDTEYRYEQALNAARILNAEGIPGTFFLAPEEAVNNPEVSKALTLTLTSSLPLARNRAPDWGEQRGNRREGEVGLHGVAVYRWQSYEEQYSRLKEGRELIEGLTGKKVWGFRPPEELYDSSTIKALLDLGYEYICADDVMDRASPTLIRVGEKSLVAFPKAQRDDYELLVKDSLRDTVEIFNALRNDFLRIYEVQGAYLLLYHSHLLCAEENLPALAQFVKFCKRKNVWFATCKEMVEWWQGFENVLLRVKRRGPSRIVVNITNGGKFGVKGIRFFIAPPEPARTISITTQGIKVPEYEIKDGGRVVALKVKSLGPHASQTFFIDCK